MKRKRWDKEAEVEGRRRRSRKREKKQRPVYSPWGVQILKHLQNAKKKQNNNNICKHAGKNINSTLMEVMKTHVSLASPGSWLSPETLSFKTPRVPVLQQRLHTIAPWNQINNELKRRWKTFKGFLLSDEWHCDDTIEKRVKREERAIDEQEPYVCLKPQSAWAAGAVVMAFSCCYCGEIRLSWNGGGRGGCKRRWGRIGIRICTLTKSRPTTRHPTVCSIVSSRTHHMPPTLSFLSFIPWSLFKSKTTTQPSLLPAEWFAPAQKGANQSRPGTSLF